MPTFPDPAPFNSAIPIGYWTQLDRFMNSMGYFYLGNPDFGSGSAASAGTALNAMITALPSNGGTIWVPPGDWTLDQAVLWNKNSVEIRGMGRGSRLLFDGGVVTTAFAMSDTTQRRGIVLRDLEILNTGVQASGVAVNASHCSNGLFHNLSIDGSTGTAKAPLKGIILDSSDSLYNLIQQVRINVAGATAEGIAFKSSAVANQIRDARVVVVAGTGGKAVFVDAASCLLDRVSVDDGSTTGFGIDVSANGHGTVILAPYLSGNDINLRLASGVESVMVKGGTIQSGVTWNIQDLGSRGVEIDSWVATEPFRYRGAITGGALPRWIMPLLDITGGEPTVSDTAAVAGRVFMSEFEVTEGVFVDAVGWINAAAPAGNARAGIVGPVDKAAEDTALSLTTKVESGSVAVGGADADAIATFTATYLAPGRYYAAVEFDTTTHTFGRSSRAGAAKQSGWGQRYDRAGGFGALTSPVPAVTTNQANIPFMRVRCIPLTTI